MRNANVLSSWLLGTPLVSSSAGFRCLKANFITDEHGYPDQTDEQPGSNQHFGKISQKPDHSSFL
jgi:hypothetical protein